MAYRSDCRYLPYSIHFSELMPILFTRKRTKHENTRSAILVWYENGRRRLLGAQSINTERGSLSISMTTNGFRKTKQYHFSVVNLAAISIFWLDEYSKTAQKMVIFSLRAWLKSVSYHFGKKAESSTFPRNATIKNIQYHSIFRLLIHVSNQLAWCKSLYS